MTKTTFYRWSVALLLSVGSLLFSAATQSLHAQSPTLSLSGTVTDAIGGVLQSATVNVKNEATGAAKSVEVDSQGHFSFSGLAPGRYSVEVSAPGFSAVSRAVQLSAGQNMDITVPLKVGDVSQQVTVEANAVGSVAAALAPMDALLDATSARTVITPAFIQNFTSPISDYGEIVNMAPNTFTTSSNGVGLGQSKTYFRGFPDGNYDIDFDGIPFYDTNSPTHHSWAFFPAQSIGGVDFDRSPGSASTTGPTPFGGSIHLLSRDLDPLQNLRVTFAGGSFNTYLYDAQYDSGAFGPGNKLNLTADVHHMQSRGYQTLNIQAQNAGSLKVQYKLSDKTTIAGYSGVVWADANTPNFSATRCQMYGVGTGYNCFITGTTLYPLTGAGINFLLTNNSDPLLYLNKQYNWYHVPTDFEYVTVQSQFGHGFSFEFKPYTYDYDNSEKFSNATTITELPASAFPATPTSPAGTHLGIPVAPCNVAVTKKGVTAIPCAVDKYNSYRKYGEVSRISQVSKFGIFNAGMWYEWANTNRHQYPTDPLNNWTDQLLPNFAEKFVTNSYQPFAEFQWHITSRLNFTPGVKFAYYTVGTKQFADDGKTIGCLVPGSCDPSKNPNINPNAFIANGGSYFSTLPSGSINYRIRNNWSAYIQAAQGSIVPPSSVFDYNQGTTGNVIPPAVLPKQQKNTTYQAGTVLKLKYFTFDADYFHVHFDNSYSSVLNSAGEPVYFLQPSSITQGFEAEANATFGHGLGVYFNGSYDHAVYSGTLNVTCNSGASCTSTIPQLTVAAPSGLWVQQTPSNIETVGATYQHHGWDAAFFDKSIGQQYIDNGAYHNQYTIGRFNMANAFVNYTLRSGGRFDQTKFRLSLNNIFNSSSATGISLAGSPLTQNITANGTTYTDPFNTSGATPINGQDNVSILAGRSIMLSVTFGLSPKR